MNITDCIKTDRLFIVAKGESAKFLIDPIRAKKCDVWTLNDYPIPATTLHFEIHDMERLKHELFKKMKDDLYRADKPPLCIFDESVKAWYSNCIMYPFGMVKRATKSNYFASTGAYMIALAIATGRFERIYLYGFDFNENIRSESLYERPNVEYWMGYAKGIGQHIDYCKDLNLMTTAKGTRKAYHE